MNSELFPITTNPSNPILHDGLARGLALLETSLFKSTLGAEVVTIPCVFGKYQSRSRGRHLPPLLQRNPGQPGVSTSVVPGWDIISFIAVSRVCRVCRAISGGCASTGTFRVVVPSLSLPLPRVLPPRGDMGGSLWGAPTPKRCPEVPIQQGWQSQGGVRGKCCLLLILGHAAAAAPLPPARGDTAVTSLFQPGLGAVPG